MSLVLATEETAGNKEMRFLKIFLIFKVFSQISFDAKSPKNGERTVSGGNPKRKLKCTYYLGVNSGVRGDSSTRGERRARADASREII